MTLPATTYRLSRPLVLMMCGGLALLVGVLWLALAIISIAGVGVPGWLLTAFLVGTVALVAAALIWLKWPPKVLELTDTGYRVRARGDVGVRAAQWSDVAAVETNGGRLVVRLEDGRTSSLPAVVVGTSLERAERDIHDRLNAAYGYRRLGED